ncbi:hypothetical protein D3C83_168520 [compost metagenome]
MAVASHVAGGLFLLLEPGYRLFGVYDIAFAVPLAALLTIAVRRERGASLVPVAIL